MSWNKSLQKVSTQQTPSHLPVLAQNVSYFIQKYGHQISETLEPDLCINLLDQLKTSFASHVVGQKKAKDILAEQVIDSIHHIGDHEWPLWVFFFHGPTGVGKTEMVKALAHTMFGDKNAFIKINCENLQQNHTSSTLFWAPPGYLWHDKSPRLNNKAIMNHYDVAKKMKKLNPMIEKFPWFSILLFDEIEKAHPNVIQQLLALVDEGKITTANGEVVNFENTIVIFTSNVGQKEITALKKKNTMWFSQENIDKTKEVQEVFQKSLSQLFSPEFIWRIWDRFVEFEELTIEDSKEIIDVILKKYNQYLKTYFNEAYIQVELSPAVYEYIAQIWFSKEKWARELVRKYNQKVKRYLNRLLHAQEFAKYYDYQGKVIIWVDVIDTQLKFHIVTLWTQKVKKDVPLLEYKGEKWKMTLEKLEKIYANISAYVELSYVNLDGDVDMRDELKIYADKLKELGLSQTEISSLKNRAYLEWLRDLIFIQDFEEIKDGNEIKDIFAPYETRTITKLIERKMAYIYENKHYNKQWFVKASISTVIEVMTRLLNIDELSGSQLNQLLFYIRKILVEMYGIHHDY